MSNYLNIEKLNVTEETPNDQSSKKLFNQTFAYYFYYFEKKKKSKKETCTYTMSDMMSKKNT